MDERCGGACGAHAPHPLQPCLARVRLVDGPSRVRGRVQVYVHEQEEGRWASICAPGPGQEATADMLCRAMQLGLAVASFDAGHELGASPAEVPRLSAAGVGACAGHVGAPNALTRCVDSAAAVGGCAGEWGLECSGEATP